MHFISVLTGLQNKRVPLPRSVISLVLYSSYPDWCIWGTDKNKKFAEWLHQDYWWYSRNGARHTD